MHHRVGWTPVSSPSFAANPPFSFSLLSTPQEPQSFLSLRAVPDSSGSAVLAPSSHKARFALDSFRQASASLPRRDTRHEGSLRTWQASSKGPETLTLARKVTVSHKEGDGSMPRGSSGRQQASHAPLRAWHGSVEPNTPEHGSLSAFQICRMITSVSEFTALIPPTCGLTHVAVTSLPGYWCEEGRRRRGDSRCSQRTLLPAQTEPCAPGESWRQRRHRGLPPAQGSWGKQHHSQVKLLPCFSFVCYTFQARSQSGW